MKIKKGDWVFTCSLKPLRFNTFEDDSDIDFWTVEGSSHSTIHCGCRVVSEEYAKWFIDNKIWELYTGSFEDYESNIRKLCVRDSIEFEGY